MVLVTMNFFLALILSAVFFIMSKSEEWNSSSKSVFECGFSSNFFTRFSFPIHYFIVALTFLILDLELVFLMPFFMEEPFNHKVFDFFFIFGFVLTMGLLLEWKSGFLDWKS